MSDGIYGAIIGDIVGSIYEHGNIKTKDFNFFNERSFFTDDTVMTLAIGCALAECAGNSENLSDAAIKQMVRFGAQYPYADYGGRFRRWLFSGEPEPYNSYGNGAAMRASSVAYFAKSMQQARELAYKVTAVTHNHPEGLKGAEATVVATFLALQGKNKEEIRKYIVQNYYPLNFTLDEIRPTYEFNETCQETVPQALEAFFESVDFEDAIRNAVSIGGDSDTLAAITGSIAGAYYGVPEKMRAFALGKLDNNLRTKLAEIEAGCPKRAA